MMLIQAPQPNRFSNRLPEQKKKKHLNLRIYFFSLLITMIVTNLHHLISRWVSETTGSSGSESLGPESAAAFALSLVHNIA